MSKQAVLVSVSSVQEDQGARSATRREHLGWRHRQPDGAYLLFDDEGTRTTIKLLPEEVRIYRRGLLNGWQYHRLAELTGGLLALGEGPRGEMVLRVQTRSLSWVDDDSTGRLCLVYDLFSADAPEPDSEPETLSLGRFTLDLAWSLVQT